MMRVRNLALFAGLGLVLLSAGCNKSATSSVNTAPFAAALNTYYQSHPSCAFEQPVTFPVDASADANIDPTEIQQLNALADAGLVAKKSKQVWSAPQGPTHIRVHETVSNYDLTDAGKAAWTANAGGSNAAGGGNFCYATPHVVSIDHASAESGTHRYGVSYSFTVSNLPSWTDNAKVKAAFPNIASDAAGKPMTGIATLTKTANGWQASGVQAINSAPMS